MKKSNDGVHWCNEINHKQKDFIQILTKLFFQPTFLFYIRKECVNKEKTVPKRSSCICNMLDFIRSIVVQKGQQANLLKDDTNIDVMF